MSEEIGALLELVTAGEWGNNQGTPGGVDTGVIRSANFTKDHQFNTKEIVVRSIEERKRQKKLLRKGDILIEKSGGSPDQPVGRVLFYDLKGEHTCSNFISILRPSQHVEAKFLYYSLCNLYEKGVVKNYQQQTTGIINLQLGEYLRESIYFPPLPEQKKIAEILSGIDFAISGIQRKIDKLRRARVALAESQLTGERHSNQANSEIGFIPSHWQMKGILEVSSVASGQVDPTSKEYREMILIAPNHIESGTGKIFGKETAIQQAAISGKYFAKLGSVILSKIRPNLAKVCMADQDCLTSADMYPLTAMNGITPAYLKQVLLSKRFTQYATESSVRGNIPKINREELSGYKFALPPLDEQMAITSGIESIETIIFKEEERVGILLGLKNSLSSDLLSGHKRVSV